MENQEFSESKNMQITHFSSSRAAAEGDGFCKFKDILISRGIMMIPNINLSWWHLTSYASRCFLWFKQFQSVSVKHRKNIRYDSYADLIWI